MKKLLVLVGVVCMVVLRPVMAQTLPSAGSASDPLFDVYEYVVEGNTLLPAVAVERALSPYMGPSRQFSDLEKARATLEQTYQNAGYLSVVVSLPNQRVDKGEVRLEVTEAALEKVRVSGANYHLPSHIRAAMPSLVLGEVPDFSQMQKEVANLQTANLQVTPLVNASDNGKGIEVDLKADDKLPLSASVEITNGQSYNTRAGRVSTVLNANNLFQRGHALSLSWQYAPYRPKDSNTQSLVYSVPLSGTDNLLASITNSNSDTLTNVSSSAPTSTISRGTFLGLRWSRTLDAMSWPIRHNVFAAVDVKNNRDANIDPDINGGGSVFGDEGSLRYPLLSAGYNLTYNNGADEVYTLSTSAKGSMQALAGRIVDCNGVQRDQFDCKRAGASADFLALQIGVGHGRPVFGHWRMNLSADVQLASGPLPSGEQYSLGGPSTVRGYYDFEQSGDEGWSARAELVSPVFLNVAGIQATALGFADRGMVKIIKPQTSQIPRTHLGSQGLGLRLSNGDGGLDIELDVARVAFDTVRPTDNGQTEYASGQKANRQYKVDLSLRQAF